MYHLLYYSIALGKNLLRMRSVSLEAHFRMLASNGTIFFNSRFSIYLMNWVELALFPDNFSSLLQGACFTSVLMSHLHSFILLTLLIRCVWVNIFFLSWFTRCILFFSEYSLPFLYYELCDTLTWCTLIILFTIKIVCLKCCQQCFNKNFLYYINSDWTE